jgi:hypothetical protein
MEKNSVVTEKDITKVTSILGKLTIQGKFAHMKSSVQMVLGGLLLPYLVDLGKVDPDDPTINEMLKKYSRGEIRKIMFPDPVEVPIEVPVEKIILERPVFRRIKNGVNKEIRKVRELCTEGRDILIRWWNTNQRLVPDDDPVCVVLTEQINALHPKEEPLSAMQIAGYFSHLCRMGRRTEEDRIDRFQRSIHRGDHTIMPKYSQPLLNAIQENWERERFDEYARKKDHLALSRRRIKGDMTPVIAAVHQGNEYLNY